MKFHKNRKRIHTVSFISDYGKLWEIDYTMEDLYTVEQILAVRINGNEYPVTCYKREQKLIKQASMHRADMYENAMADLYDSEETHHMIDNF